MIRSIANIIKNANFFYTTIKSGFPLFEPSNFILKYLKPSFLQDFFFQICQVYLKRVSKRNNIEW